MLNRDGYAALGLVYDTALNLGRWRRALDAVSTALEAKAAALLIRQNQSSSKDRQLLSSAYLDFSRSPQGLYYGLRYSRLQDPDWTFLSHQRAQVPVPDTQIGLSTAQLDARGDYAFLRRKLGLGRRLGVRLNGDQVWFDAISIAFDHRLPAIPQSALQQTAHLLPHLTKAIEIGRTFTQLKSRYNAILTSLDRVKIGLAIALPSGELLVENEEAKRIFSLKDGVTKSRSGALACHLDDQTAELKQAIASASNTAQGQEAVPEHLFAIKRPSHNTPFLVEVAPLKDSTSEMNADFAGALVNIVDPDRVSDLNIDRFVLIYALTPAEAEVCKLLLQGHQPDQVAQIRNTAPVTIKNQIASIFAKTGVTRRSDLIRLLVRVLPPIE